MKLCKHLCKNNVVKFSSKNKLKRIKCDPESLDNGNL